MEKRNRNLRNICILAHVDHGKTTLSDSLLATNGIISQKLAGRVRYLDSRPDEQERGITMKSSAISLRFQVELRSDDANKKSMGTTVEEERREEFAPGKSRDENARSSTQTTEFLVNLIDSPGHVDFSSEVSVASRLCDGALVLVDAVEGVCTQTMHVLRQAWSENVAPVLILNKLDRLIIEMKLTPLEAYLHLNRILEQVNALMATFSLDERIQREDKRYEEQQSLVLAEIPENDFAESLQLDSGCTFQPDKGNVVFCSAIDGWAFRVSDFANIYATKLGVNEKILNKVLWGEYYFDAKAKRVLTPKHLKGRPLKLMAVQFMLDNIWTAYDAITVNPNPDKAEKIVSSLQLKVLSRDLRSKDTKAAIRAVMSQWLPLSTTVLLSVIDQVPNPTDAQANRIPTILSSIPNGADVPHAIRDALCRCDADAAKAPVIAYIAKMFSVPLDAIQSTKKRIVISEEERRARREQLIRERKEQAAKMDGSSEDASGSSDPVTAGPAQATSPVLSQHDGTTPAFDDDLKREILVGFARIYSGTIRVGMPVHVLGPKYDFQNPGKFRSAAKVERLFMMMGRDLIEVEEVVAGNVFAVYGVHESVLKTATISTVLECPSFGSVMKDPATTILRVAVEPQNPLEWSKLTEGLKMLNQADPCVEILVQETGEHVLMTAGELHLERCLRDLRERFAKIEIQVSSPIVPFRETIVEKLVRKEGDLITITSPNKTIHLEVRCFLLPSKVVEYINAQQALFRDVFGDNDESSVGKSIHGEQLLSELERICDESGHPALKNLKDKLWSIGPKRTGPNLLVNNIQDYTLGRRWPLPADLSTGSTLGPLDSSVVAGFQLAVNAGPLCGEPIHGVCFSVESFKVESTEEAAGALTGQTISTMKEACRQAFLAWSPRLMLAMYSCEIQATADVLGKVYAVVGRRRGRIVSEEMKDGTSFFSVKALIPVMESMGFSDELRKRTSGVAQPQLFYAGWETLDEDPFWVPTTEEELEDLGEKADRENLARKYMTQIRKRKGMFVEEKLVEHAEKQKTSKVK